MSNDDLSLFLDGFSQVFAEHTTSLVDIVSYSDSASVEGLLRSVFRVHAFAVREELVRLLCEGNWIGMDSFNEGIGRGQGVAEDALKEAGAFVNEEGVLDYNTWETQSDQASDDDE